MNFGKRSELAQKENDLIGDLGPDIYGLWADRLVGPSANEPRSWLIARRIPSSRPLHPNDQTESTTTRSHPLPL